MTAYSRSTAKAVGFLACAAVVLSLPACGGGDSTGTVTGTIKANGRDIPRGLITFVPEKGEPKICAIVDSKYDSGPIPTGPYKMTVAINDMGGSKAKKGTIGEGLGAGDDKVAPKTNAAKKAALDPKYGDTNASGLSITVVEGPNTFDADLK